MNNFHSKTGKTIPFKFIQIKDEFWNNRLKINKDIAIFNQWKQLEKSHNQDNFRILAGKMTGYRFGFFYCDSDLHKWVDAAARILTLNKNSKLSKLIQEYIELIYKVQTKDGYLFTYNQFHFPNQRWRNLQIEHELYCIGHMIEAAVSFLETDEPEIYKRKFLEVACKAADLLVDKFLNASPKYTPGHPEIEIALIRLFHTTRKKDYLSLAEHFLYQRGKTRFFGLRLLAQALDQKKRTKVIKKDMEKKKISENSRIDFFGGETKHTKEAPFLAIRSFFQYFSGRYQQQNKPIIKMKRPFGHAVRWGYLATAMAKLYQENRDERIILALKQTWNHLVEKQMFITGGIGALGTIEGFGRDYELQSNYCYCETCATIANILLNWELAKITNDACYSDLLEWQLYNALSVGISLDGQSYLYRNLLETKGELTRKTWFATPCCPSNISRIWVSIGNYIYTYDNENIWIHQYFGNSTQIPLENGNFLVHLNINSELPWGGKIKIIMEIPESREFKVHIRIPNWTENPAIKIDGKKIPITCDETSYIPTGSGFNPKKAIFYPIWRFWKKHSIIEITFPMKVNIHKSHPKVKANRNKIAFSRGPLVYCFESCDNPSNIIPNLSLDLTKKIHDTYDERLLNGVIKLFMKDKNGKQLIAIPYFAWANRQPSAMQVWVRSDY